MKISSDISLYEANFNANPQDLSSSESFRFSFRIWSPQFTAESHDRLWASLQEALPAFQKYGGWGGADAAKNSEVLDIYIEGHGDYCKYLVDMFRQGGVRLTSNGYAYQEHPLFPSIPAPENLPPVLRDFDSFKTLICSTIDKGLKRGLKEETVERSAINSQPAGMAGRLDALNG